MSHELYKAQRVDPDSKAPGGKRVPCNNVLPGIQGTVPIVEAKDKAVFLLGLGQFLVDTVTGI
jgi:hypothetical protein